MKGFFETKSLAEAKQIALAKVQALSETEQIEPQTDFLEASTTQQELKLQRTKGALATPRGCRRKASTKKST